MKKRMKVAVTLLSLAIVCILPLGGCSTGDERNAKPVIYLYPEERTDVTVKLTYSGQLTTTYPVYQDGWEVTAEPDGTLTDKRDGKEYSYLFWEGLTNAEYDLSKGFVVKGEVTRDFLQTILPKMGLLPKEYNEFIVYWLPKMEGNPYNLITFQTDRYTEGAKLTISPEPDSILRVFMAYRPLSTPVSVEEPEIVPFERKGFVVVEWGGSEIG
jgi:hypothetical protein